MPKVKSQPFPLAESVANLAKAFDARPAGRSDRPGWIFDTVNGPLEVTAMDHWIALRFHEPKKVGPMPGSEFNDYSGKWNIHRYMNTGQELPDPAACYAELVRRINEITTHVQEETALRT
jgi:hypothetical protein